MDPVIGVPGINDLVVYGSVDVDGDVVLGYDALGGSTGTCRARSSTWILQLIIPRVSVQGLM